MDTKYDEIYDPPLSKELLFNKKNNQNEKSNSNTKLAKIPKMKFNIKLNNFELNNKKVGTMFNINNLGNNKFINNKKTEYANKFTNTNRNNFPDYPKKEKINSMNSSKKI